MPAAGAAAARSASSDSAPPHVSESISVWTRRARWSLDISRHRTCARPRPAVRIAVIEIAPFGGLLHYAVQLGDALAQRGDDVDLVVAAENELSARTGPARRLAVLPPWLTQPRGDEGRLAILRRRAGALLWRLATWREIVKTVRRGRYDAVILNGSIDLSLSAVAALAL